MSTLLTEYCKRKGNNFTIPTNDGLCFFNEHNRPALVCLTGFSPKTLSFCHNCLQNDTIAIELLLPDREVGFVSRGHYHVSADSDLTSFIGKMGLPYEPVSLKDGRWVEIWLWKFFLFHSKLRRSRAWQTWTKTAVPKEDPTKTYEEMTYCAMHHPSTYKVYYNMYQNLITGRKYLLFE